MLFSDITILDEYYEIKTHQYVGIEDDRIDYIGIDKPQKNYGEIYKGNNKLLMSGLYNCHTHSPMTLLRGFAENKRLFDWLNMVQPIEQTFSDADIYTGTTLALAEMLRHGTVSCTEMYLNIETVAEAFSNAAFKGNISWGISSESGKNISQYKSVLSTEANWKKYSSLESDQIIPEIAIHAEYTSNEEIVEFVADYARSKNLRIHVHVSETSTEHNECKKRHMGLTPVQYFDKHGLFQQPVTAAHCVWVESEDIEIMKAHNVTVASCPFSNLKLASGFCNLSELVRQGINVTIATDGSASNNSLNQFAEMKVAATLAKAVSENPTVLTSKEILAMVTRNGALAQGRMDCGAIKIGNCADCIVIDLNQPQYTPLYDIKNSLVYSSTGNEVCMTMVNGKVLYKNGEYTCIDIEKIKYEANQIKERNLNR